MKKVIFTIRFTVEMIVMLTLLGTSNNVSAQNISEYCFGNENLGVKVETTTPSAFLKNNPLTNAAINGPYYDLTGRTEGTVIIRNNSQTSVIACCSGEIRGYLYVAGGTVIAGTMIPSYLDDNRNITIIGTHPLLVVDGEVHSQAKEARYNLTKNGSPRSAFRSALGTKDGVYLCMVVSETQLTMEQWAELLQAEGYTQAINLDGGPISQLAVRGKEPHGGGDSGSPTRLIIYAFK